MLQFLLYTDLHHYTPSSTSLRNCLVGVPSCPIMYYHWCHNNITEEMFWIRKLFKISQFLHNELKTVKNSLGLFLTIHLYMITKSYKRNKTNLSLSIICITYNVDIKEIVLFSDILNLTFQEFSPPFHCYIVVCIYYY